MKNILVIIWGMLLFFLGACSNELQGKEAPMPSVTSFNVQKQSDIEVPHVAETICWNNCAVDKKDPYSIQPKESVKLDNDNPISISFEGMEPKPSTINLINETTGDHIQVDSEWITLNPPDKGEYVYRIHLFWNSDKGAPLGELMYVFSVR
ncbi:hypothetical protein [Pseudalkalibacillus decolorationis]|uniref:hypothetical protein n=1 Tax=Pseudalkalibacillus decolorationis TaxID=163879 RepID=UPI0021492C46|nr:hypothetical protein [Pseudalkalibacillus decolorationis]